MTDTPDINRARYAFWGDSASELATLVAANAAGITAATLLGSAPYEPKMATLSLLDYGTRALAGTAMTAALAAIDVTAHSVISVPAGALTWNVTPAIPVGITGSLTIDFNDTLVTLTSVGRRLFDIARTADYQTFENVKILGPLTVDAANLGGQHHVVLGSYIAGSHNTARRLNLAHILISGVRTINVPVDSTLVNHRLNVWLESFHLNDAEGTQTTVTDVVVERCRFEGGNYGAAIIGSSNAGGLNTNIYLDDVHIRDCWHSLLAVQTVDFASAHFHLGSRGYGGRGTIEGCRGYYSGDVGFEVDGLEIATLSDCFAEDSFNRGFYITNYNNATPAEQEINLDDCQSRHLLTAIDGSNSAGFRITTAPNSDAIPIGTVRLDGCSVYRNGVQGADGSNEWLQVDGWVNEVLVNGFKGRTVTTATVASHATNAISVQVAGDKTMVVRLRNVRGYGRVAYSGSGSPLWKTLQLYGGGGTATMLVDVDGWTLDTSTSGSAPSTTIRNVNLGISSFVRMSGAFNNMTFIGDSEVRAFDIFGSGSVGGGRLDFNDLNFSQLSSSSAFFNFRATSVAGRCFVDGNNSGTNASRPASLTPGLLYRTTDNPRGLYRDDGTAWQPMSSILVCRTGDATAVNSGTTGTTLTNDDTLLWAIDTADIWFFEMFLLVSAANGTMDAKFGLSGPTGATASWGGLAGLNSEISGYGARSTSNNPLAMTAIGGSVSVGTLNGICGISLGGLVVGGGTAGNVVLQWAQNTADAGNLLLKANSFLRATRLSP